MSIETIHNSLEINELFNKINSNEITNDNNKILKKSEKCRLIRNHFFDLLYKDKYPDSYKSIIYTDTPMLCLRMKQLEQNEQIELWKSDDYIADEKIDGLRCYLVYNKDYDKNNGYELFSRENDEETLLPKNITNLFNNTLNRPNEFYKSFLIDCELVIDNNMNSYLKSFDCVYFNDSYITEEQWNFRRFITEKITESISSPFLTTTKYIKLHKLDFFNFIKTNGGEGVVIKNITSKYSLKGTRSKYNWIKVKGNIYDYSIIEDTLEGYVSNKKSNNNSIELSAFINNDETSRKIALIPIEMLSYINRNTFTNQNVELGSIIEFSSTFYSNQENIFKNTFPIKIRMDKSIKDCFYSSKDIDRWSA